MWLQLQRKNPDLYDDLSFVKPRSLLLLTTHRLADCRLQSTCCDFPAKTKSPGTDDDWVVRDGVIMKLSDVAKGGVGRCVSAGVLQP